MRRLTGLCGLLLALVAGSAWALDLSTTNPIWPVDSNGKAVLLSGVSSGNDQCNISWKGFLDITDSSTPIVCDFAAKIDEAKLIGHNFARVWNLEQTAHGDDADFTGGTWLRIPLDQQPYLQTGTRTRTPNGVNVDVGIYDLSQYNPAWFARLTQRAEIARQKNFHLSFMLFSGGHLLYHEHNGFSHPYDSGNNINGVAADTNADGHVEEVHQLGNAAITAFQDGYICKVVEALKAHSNVILEVSNEDLRDSTDWQNHVMERVRFCEQAVGSVRHLVWLSPYYFSVGQMPNNLPFVANPRADIGGPACLGGEDYESNPPRNAGDKIRIHDSDHANAGCLAGVLTEDWVFKNVLSGVHPVFLDLRESASVRDAIKRRQGYAIAYANKMHLLGMTPDVNGSQAYPATGILDDFNRANAGPPPSASWVNSLGSGLKVVSNELQPNAYGADHGSSWNTSLNADQEFYVRFGRTSPFPTNESGTFCIYLRMVTANDFTSNHYEICATPRSGNDVVEVYKVVATVYTKLGGDIAIGRNFSSSDTFGAAMRGSTLSVVLNGAVIGTVADGAIAGSGYAGAAFISMTSGSVDYVGGGNLPALSSGVCSTGYCLRELGKEYLLGRPSGSTNPTIDLTNYPNETFTVEYMNPATGAITAQANVMGGAVRTFTIGWTGEAIVYVKVTPVGPTVVQSTSGCFGDTNAAAVCTFASPPAVGNKILLLLSMQQYPFTSSCSQVKQITDPHGTNHYDLAVEGPVQGSSQSSIWFRDVIQPASGTFSVSVTCNAAGANTHLAMVALEVAGAVPSYAALDAPGWASGRNLSSLTVTSFTQTSQANALLTAVLAMNVPEAVITTQSGWTERYNNGDTSAHAAGAAATKPIFASETPAHTWGISYVTGSGSDDAQAVIAAFRGVTVGGGSTQILRTLRWTDNASNEASFRVEKRTDLTFPNWVVVNDGLNPNTVTYTAPIDATELNDCWRVFAINANGERMSNEACGPLPNVPPPPPLSPPPPVIQIGGLQTLMDDELL